MMASRRLIESKSGKMVAGQRKDKLSAARKPVSSSKRVLLTGWDLPLVADENDIVGWMKREKNGDNKKKPVRDEEIPEEQYRHLFARCKQLENQMEFERESLHEKYRKHCQVGPVQPESLKTSQSNHKLGKLKEENVDELPERNLIFPRSCKSAELPATPKVSTLMQEGLDSDRKDSLFLSRSHSVIDDTKLRAYGLTLPPDEKTARLLELAGSFIAKAELAAQKVKVAQNEVLDEGYDSKVSSNDADLPDDEVEGSKVAQYDTASVYTNLDSVVNDQSMAGFDINPADMTAIWAGHEYAGDEQEYLPSHRSMSDSEKHSEEAQHLVQVPVSTLESGRDAIAKLMYSCRDRSVYERMPSRRMRNPGFRYAGKEQSRLMETSLNTITPGYLSMHQFSNVSNFLHYPVQHPHSEFMQQQQLLQQEQEQQQQQRQKQSQQQNQQQQQHQQDTLPKTVALTRISLQDSGGADSAERIHSGGDASNSYLLRNISPNTRTSNRQQSAKRAMDLRLERSNSAKQQSHISKDNTNGAVADVTISEVNDASNVEFTEKQTFLQNTDGVSSNKPMQFSMSLYLRGLKSGPSGSKGTVTDADHSSTPKTVYTRNTLTVDSISSVRSPRTCSPTPLDTCRTAGSNGQPTEKSYSTSSFPMADLLPAVERNLRRRAIHGLGKQQLIYRSQTSLDATAWKQAGALGGAGGVPPATASCQDLYSSSMLGGDDHRMHRSRRMSRDGRVPPGIPLILQQKGHGPPGFRPHQSLSPLQRAKEIAARRIHGHITTLPDGSETVRVTSPQYQTLKMDRINSASRAQPGRPRITCDVKALVKSCPVTSRRRSPTVI